MPERGQRKSVMTSDPSEPFWRKIEQGAILGLLLTLLCLLLSAGCSTTQSTVAIKPSLPDPPPSLQRKLPDLPKP